jgi:hypothetical protein
MPGIASNRGISQPRRGLGEHEPSQHIGLERSEFLRAHRPALLAQLPHHRQNQPKPSLST